MTFLMPKSIALLSVLFCMSWHMARLAAQEPNCAQIAAMARMARAKSANELGEHAGLTVITYQDKAGLSNTPFEQLSFRIRNIFRGA
jgi:hypothetical protein